MPHTQKMKQNKKKTRHRKRETKSWHKWSHWNSYGLRTCLQCWKRSSLSLSLSYSLAYSLALFISNEFQTNSLRKKRPNSENEEKKPNVTLTERKNDGSNVMMGNAERKRALKNSISLQIVWHSKQSQNFTVTTIAANSKRKCYNDGFKKLKRKLCEMLSQHPFDCTPVNA